VSTAVDCLNDMDKLINSTFVRKTTINECRFSKLAGLILLFIAIISFVINTHCSMTIRRNHQISSRDRNLVFGMFISSLCVITISVPSVVIQCFRCRRLCSTLICQIEGFNSFLNSCITMYMLVALSIIRYSTTANASSRNVQYLFKKYNLSLSIICFILGSIWAIPPIFGHMSVYAPDGLGFHCGLNWFDRSLASRIYFLLLFVGVYFIPMIIIIYVNIYIHRTVYRLTHLSPIVSLEVTNQYLLRKHISNTSLNQATKRLHRLYEDRRFVLATGISLIIYLIAWTPYGIVALAQVFGDSFSLYNPWLMTTCALVAKLSMIINPIIYTTVLKNRKIILIVQ